MVTRYTREKNVQVIIRVLKAHNIRYVIASPGSANTSFVCSVQDDPWFKVFSSVDERSAAYMACGLAAETGEAVVMSCTGATASRNYASGLTEAFYRKLPVLAITSTQNVAKIGHHIAQVVDRSTIQNDVARLSVTLPIVKDDEDLWECEIAVNKAVLELFRHGGGPAHINLQTTYAKPYDVETIPNYRLINRITPAGEFPALNGRVAVAVGSHKRWSPAETAALEQFALAFDAPVFCDHTSGYRGQNRLVFALGAAQHMFERAAYHPDVLIHIGEITGDYASMALNGTAVWRVSEDGEIRDLYRRLRHVFEMPEQVFFEHYAATRAAGGTAPGTAYVDQCRTYLADMRSRVPELPLSNIWLAQQMAPRLPSPASIHFAILNSLRSWNFFDIPAGVSSFSNVGGFGIDGCTSALLGGSLADPDKLQFLVTGDLAFFYDLNVLGNRHVGRNLRILLVNNGTGTEFKNYNHHAATFQDGADRFVAARGHFGQQSRTLVRDYATNLGFEYLSAASKDEAAACIERFVTPGLTDKPMIFEAFTEEADESIALKAMQSIHQNPGSRVKNIVRRVLGPTIIGAIKGNRGGGGGGGNAGS